MNQLLGVIGDPIEHSLSPAMHSFWYKKYGLSHHYHAFKVMSADLKKAVAGFRALGIKGFNVTIPHKINIIPLLDDIDEEARLLGAVNTVAYADNKLIGYNTDGLGFLHSLKEAFPEVLKRKPNILILGAGGAARAVGLTLAKHTGGRIDFANRTVSKAEDLSASCLRFGESAVKTLTEAEEVLHCYDLIINATSVGLAPRSDQTPIKLTNCSSNTVIADLIYKPLTTKWLREGRAMGLQTLNGLPMLMYQGALAFEHWFGYLPETQDILTYLEQTLEVSHADK
ncbi:shikimate dehydrogenase [Scopulibacillus darangshiensis]|uniref:Shikimate dehydrogenase (NADP(+)) n=1 Tax=Scopulibacillus darangshiensis TaxID=442528 RepID=A0A4V2SNS0_9BACL|nr:shikimate dehydrogenase [Scopulibacillus darangshiensis]TCP32316.1 shikimate dehydrogenase [Scopulibacillus darangshiensis]